MLLCISGGPSGKLCKLLTGQSFFGERAFNKLSIGCQLCSIYTHKSIGSAKIETEQALWMIEPDGRFLRCITLTVSPWLYTVHSYDICRDDVRFYIESPSSPNTHCTLKKWNQLLQHATPLQPHLLPKYLTCTCMRYTNNTRRPTPLLWKWKKYELNGAWVADVECNLGSLQLGLM